MTSQTYEVDTRKLPARPGVPATHGARAEPPDRGKPAYAACRSDRDDAVLDGEMDQLRAGLQFERIHHLIFVVLDGAR